MKFYNPPEVTMRVNQVYADMECWNTPGVKVVLTLEFDNRKRTKVWVVVDNLPHKKERSYYGWKKFEDSITDDPRLSLIFGGKTPQWVRKNFPELRMTYRHFRKILREHETP